MAGKIPQHFIDEVLSRTDIVDVIDARVTLKKRGNSHVACCPFHNEKTPSFNVSQQKQFYHCFGCGQSGSAISFLMEYENMHFVDAIELLAENLGLEVPREGGDVARPHNESKPLFELLELVSLFYQQRLKEHPPAIEYLKNRGLSGEVAQRYGIGFAPDGWDALNKQFPENEAMLLKTGMLKTSDKEGASQQRAYQRFRDRIMFPIRDRRGRVIAFGGRVMGQGEPKYLNSPETPLFHKGSELYGLYEARKAAQDAGSVIVVEGYMDVVALAQHGINNSVATLGTAANQQHSDILFKIVPNIVFCFDGDSAGRKAAWRALESTLPSLQDGRDAHFLFLPDGEDPDTIVSNSGAAGFNDRLAARVPIIDYLYEHLAKDIDITSIGGKAQLAEKAKPLVSTIQPGVYQQLAYRRLEALIGIPLGPSQARPHGRSHNASLGGTRGQRPQPRAQKSILSKQGDEGLTQMSRAVLIVLQHPRVVACLEGETNPVDDSERGANILNQLITDIQLEPTISTAMILERLREMPEHVYLTRLAVRPLYPDGRELDDDSALAEFKHAIEQLRKRSGRTHTDQLDQSKRRGLLSRRRGSPT